MHLVPDDGFEHEVRDAWSSCPCEPYPEEIPSFGANVYFGSAIVHRDMRVPDTVPEEWIDS